MKTFRSLPPWRAASSYESAAEARRAGRETALALRRAGVHAALAPCSTSPTGRSACATRAARVRRRVRARSRPGGVREAPPGLGSTPKSTDVARVYGVLRSEDLAPFRAAVRAGVPRDGRPRDLPAARPALGLVRAGDALLRRLGFRGVAITDSLGVLGSRYAPFWARLPAARARTWC